MTHGKGSRQECTLTVGEKALYTALFGAPGGAVTTRIRRIELSEAGLNPVTRLETGLRQRLAKGIIPGSREGWNRETGSG